MKNNLPKNHQMHGMTVNSDVVARQGVSKFMNSPTKFASVLKVSDGHKEGKIYIKKGYKKGGQ